MKMREIVRKYKFSLILMFFSLLLLGWVSTPVMAHDELIIEEMVISVWPEYFTPDVVVNQASLFVNPTDQPIEGELWFWLPKTAQPLTVVEYRDGIHAHYYETIDKGDHLLLRYELDGPIEPGERLPMVMEYRHSHFHEGGHRTIDLELVSKYDIDNLAVEIKQPLRSTNFLLTPDAESKTMDSEGFDIYHYAYQDIKQDQLVEIQFSYHKEDNLPSLDTTPAESADHNHQHGPGGYSVALLVMIFLAILGLTLLVALRQNPSFGSKGKTKANRKKKAPASVKTKGKKTGTQSQSISPGEQRKKLRRMLVEGKITEEAYQKQMEQLEKR